MDTSTASGAISISEQAIEKIFLSELEFMKSIRSLISTSSLSAERKSMAKVITDTKITVMVKGLKWHQGRSINTGIRRTNAEITMCENYFMVLDKLLDLQDDSYSNVLALMKKYWYSVRAEERVNPQDFESIAEQALYLIFRFCYIENIRFSKLHSQIMAHLALVEYRLRNGWLIGKYNAQWTKLSEDSYVVHAWVNKSGMNLVMEAYRFEIPRIHQATKGQTPTGM